MGYLRETDELICYDVINPIQYIFHDDTETFTLVYTEYDEDYEKFYAEALRDAEEAKKTREYGFDIMNHPNCLMRHVYRGCLMMPCILNCPMFICFLRLSSTGENTGRRTADL